MGDVLVRKAIFNEWNFFFRRNLFDWEKESQTELSNLLDDSGVVARDEREDRLSWFGCNSNVFSVKSFYNLISQMLQILYENVILVQILHMCTNEKVYLGY